MFKRIAAIFAALTLALAVTACGQENRSDTANGGSQTRPDTNQSQNGQQNDGTGGSWQNGTDTPTQPGAGVGGAAGSQENSQSGGSDGLTGDNDAQDDARMGRSTLRRGAESTATFRQMLENGYVHDSDGFLNDGENTSW